MTAYDKALMDRIALRERIDREIWDEAMRTSIHSGSDIKAALLEIAIRERLAYLELLEIVAKGDPK